MLGDEGLASEIRNAAVRLSTACRWVDPNDAESAASDAARDASDIKFRIAPRPVLFLQDRPTGIKEAVESIRARIDDSSDIPQHLVEIVSPDAFPTYTPEDDRKPTLEEKLAATAGEDETILLTKPANTEQLAIARSIVRRVTRRDDRVGAHFAVAGFVHEAPPRLRIDRQPPLLKKRGLSDQAG